MTEYSIDLRPRQSFLGADAVSATETAVAAAAAGAAVISIGYRRKKN